METQLRLTQESPRRRGYPSSKRLSENARRTGREGVAMARRELERVRNASIATSTDRQVTSRQQPQSTQPATPTRSAA